MKRAKPPRRSPQVTKARSCGGECTEGQACFWGEDCTPECHDQVVLNAGTITVTGATAQPTVTGTWDDLYNYDWTLVENGNFCSVGDTLHIAAEGGSFPAFYMDVPAPEDIVLTTDTSDWTMEQMTGEEDIPLAWTPGTGDFVIQIDGNFYTVTCNTADDGSFVIPTAAIEALGSNTFITFTFSRLRSTLLHEGEDGEVTGTVRTDLSFGFDLTP